MFIPIVRDCLTIHWLKIINKRLAKLFWCGEVLPLFLHHTKQNTMTQETILKIQEATKFKYGADDKIDYVRMVRNYADLAGHTPPLKIWI
jgi:hypothetical protein